MAARTHAGDGAAGRPDGPMPLVSVIVAVRNEGARLHQLLAALDAQTLSRHRFEVIVADDGSTDGSTGPTLLADDRVRVVRCPPVNQAAAQNRAIAVAGGLVLAFTDGDCEPEPDWLERALEALESADIVAGRVRRRLPVRATRWTLLDVDLFLDQESAVAGGYGVGANLVLRRDVVDAVGGLDDVSASGSDYDLVARARERGARLVYAPDAVVLHPTRDSLRAVLRKVWRINYGYAARETARGGRPERLRLRSWIPLAQAAYGRLRYRHCLGLDRRRLLASGLEARLGDELRVWPVLFLVIPFLANVAQVSGWRAGRRLRAASVSPGTAVVRAGG